MPLRLLAPIIGALLVLPVSPALAAPATVDLRIEGRNATLYEGTVTTDVRTIDVNDGTGPHKCDGTNNGANPTPGPTRGAAFATAAAGPGGFAFSGTYFASFDDVGFNQVAGESVAFDPASGTFLAEYENGVASQVGSCQDLIANGDSVLYALGTGAEPVLALSGPGTVAPGGAAPVRVTNEATGAAVAGATVGSATTAADGTAQVPIASSGPTALKASAPGAIRSNRLVVCATTGSDGACGSALTPGAPGVGSVGPGARPGRDVIAPRATVRGIREQQRFARGRGPRRLQASVVDAGGVRQVKLRLTRTDGRRCTYFSGSRETFRRNRGGRCGATRGFWFAVGDSPNVDYLLPERLPRGRYVLDVNAIDRAFNRDDRRRRTGNRVVFHVR